MPDKIYLGDGAYAAFSPSGDMEITTEDGLTVLNRVYLEPLTFEALVRYAKAEPAFADAIKRGLA